ncbi:hypothetical protein SLEP1_g52356 [Rubroshorea leprosula]|uniref:Integrase catalytic domain-containing protein n=1 Tax=Rubroshorea leprosula TaxID=152421 RepID=A0AAV5M9E0_9ROSI|nr:hypothetical protein SLEP1_g52356 [Rubroshorea leprosula]
MPPKRNVGKAAQTLQIGLGEGSPAHSKGENEPIIPPPLSPIFGEHSFVNPTFNKDSESGDDVAQSGDSLMKAVSDQISIMRHTLLESEEKAQQRSQEPPPQIQQAAGRPVQPDPVEAAPCAAELGNHQQPRYLPPPRRPNGGHQQHNAPPLSEHFQPYVPLVQQNLQNLPGQYINRDQIINMVQEAYGLVLRPLVKPAYRKPYPDFIDQENPFPRGFKVLEFTLFSKDGGYSTIEHIGRFTIQCGEASSDDNLKLRLFPSSLTSTALTCEPKVSMADLSRLVQRPGETSEAFLAKFRKARLTCRVALPEQEFVKLEQKGLDIELRKKFEGMEFRDFFELSYKVAHYENLLQDDTQRKSASHGTYYGDVNFDLNVAEVVADKPVVCPDLVKVAQQTNKTDKIDKGILCFPDKAKETMGVDADPFPTMSVGVNAADLRSIARDRIQTYYRCRLAADDLRWVIEGTAISGRTEKPRMVKPPPRSPSKRWELVVHPKFPKDQAQPLPARRKSVWVHKVKGSTSNQNSPEKEEPPKSPTSPRVLAVESNEETGLKAKFDMSDEPKNSSDVICFGEFSVNLSCLVITLPLVFQAREQPESAVCHQTDLIKEKKSLRSQTEVVKADDKPFVANTNAVEAHYYDEDIGTSRFFGMDRYGRPSGITACTRSAMDRQTVKEKDRIKHQKKEAVEEIKRKLVAYLAEKRICVDRSKVVYEGEEEHLKDQITLEELDLAPAKLDDLKAKVQDPLKEVNLGLDRNLVEHRLSIREDFKPFKQPPRRMSPKVTLKLKEEIERLLKVGFMRTSRYVEWLSNVVHVIKKNSKLRICVDFRNLNLATLKDEYHMPIADLLVDGAAHHRILSFMDGHSGYNQIFIAEEDIPKTAFRCLGAIGTYEWVVMPFGLKNVGATYQRAMNAIFHDMIGHFMEIYIDDVVVKSNEDEEHLEHLKLAFERMRKHGLEMDQNKARAVIEAQPPRRKTRVFSPLLKLKSEADFKWERHQQTAFEEIKHYLSKPPVLVPPLRDKPLILYISAADESVVHIVSTTVGGRIGKWVLALSKFNLKYMPQKAVKGQALADFLTDHLCLEVEADEEKDFNCTNNQAEYEALIIGLEVLVELKVPVVEIIDYFTKWVEAKPMKKVDHTDIIKFLKEEIIHKFGSPETVTSDQGTVFVGAQVEAFAKEMGFRLLTSTPHYAQANGQAEASNRIVINLTSQRSSTKVTPFSLTYGHDAVLPMELSARSLRIAIQHGLIFGEYNEALILELEDLEGMRLMALNRLQTQKLKVARAYNKRVKSRSLAVRDLVWKVILPPGKKDPRFGKWSPNWEGPFRIHEVLRGGAYWLESLNGELHPRKINRIYLKPCYPMVWEARGLNTINST